MDGEGRLIGRGSVFSIKMKKAGISVPAFLYALQRRERPRSFLTLSKYLCTINCFVLFKAEKMY